MNQLTPEQQIERTCQRFYNPVLRGYFFTSKSKFYKTSFNPQIHFAERRILIILWNIFLLQKWDTFYFCSFLKHTQVARFNYSVNPEHMCLVELPLLGAVERVCKDFPDYTFVSHNQFPQVKVVQKIC